MTYAVRPEDFATFRRAPHPARPGLVGRTFALLGRVYDAVIASREWHANQELAGYMKRAGGRLTDDMERDIMRRLTTGDWNTRR